MNWKRVFKWVGTIAGSLVGLAALFFLYQTISYGRAANRVYDVPPLTISASTNDAVIARGHHLAEVTGCTDCHGAQLQGKTGEDLGPIGKMNAPNLTTGAGGVGNDYSDGELGRAIKHGIKNNGQTALFMPSMDYNWLPENELVAIVSFIRSVPPSDHVVEPASVGPLGEVLNQLGVFPITAASNIDHDAEAPDVPDPEPTSRYGYFLALGCVACHGENFSGGKIPGAPGDMPIPANITLHGTGIGLWTYEDFVTSVTTGVRPDGRTLDPFMPTNGFKAMNEIELRALWEFLSSIEPLAFGNR